MDGWNNRNESGGGVGVDLGLLNAFISPKPARTDRCGKVVPCNRLCFPMSDGRHGILNQYDMFRPVLKTAGVP